MIQHRRKSVGAALALVVAGAFVVAGAILALGQGTAAADEAAQTSTIAPPATTSTPASTTTPASTSSPATTPAPASSTPASATPTPATAPLPASNYRVRDACRAPSPGRVSCRAQELVPKTAAAAAHTHPLGVVRTTPLKAPTPAEGAYGLRPEDLRDAYFPGEAPDAPAASTQTIALIEAYNDLSAQTDLEAYGQAFKPKLPTLSTCSSPAAVEPGCFEKVNQKGEAGEASLPFPRNEAEYEAAQKLCGEREDTSGAGEPIKEWEEKEEACLLTEEAEGWSEETSLDIEMAHAVCQNCRIVLVEAESPEGGPLEEAEDTAAAPASSGGVGATEISNSWGGEEEAKDSEAFNHPGIVITAAAGDNGYLNWTEAEEAKALRRPYNAGAEYPASSPHVVAVGGTHLELSEAGTWQGETVWNDDNSSENNGAGGSGCSGDLSAPEWQRDLPNWSAVGCESHRAVADVSADGDPYTGVAVYDSESYCEYGYTESGKTYVVRTPWCTFGGTSVGTPLIAAMYALAGGAGVGTNGKPVEYPAKTLYEHLETGLLHTVTGSNGECDGDYASGCAGSMDTSSARYDFDCGQGVLICNAAAGCEGDYYAGPTGVGSPDGIGAFKPGEDLTKDAKACEQQSSPGGGGSGSGESGSDGSGGGSNAGSTGPSTSNQGELVSTSGASTGTAGTGTTAGKTSSPDPTPVAPVLSALTLAHTAMTALRHGRPKVTRIAFAFTLNVSARVQVTLARQVTVHGRKRWRTLPYTIALAAKRGHDAGRLSAHGTLVAGRYRLTLTPAGGKPRTLTFRVG